MYRKNNMTKIHNGAENLKRAKLTKESWQAFIESDYVVSEQGECFSEILSRYIEEMQELYDVSIAFIIVKYCIKNVKTRGFFCFWTTILQVTDYFCHIKDTAPLRGMCL